MHSPMHGHPFFDTSPCNNLPPVDSTAAWGGPARPRLVAWRITTCGARTMWWVNRRSTYKVEWSPPSSPTLFLPLPPRAGRPLKEGWV